MPLPARQSQHSVPTENWWLPHRAGEEHTETGTEAPRAHTEPARSRDRAVWQPTVPKHGLAGAGAEFALSTHTGGLTAGSLPVLGLWVALGHAGPQPSCSAPLPWVTAVPSLAGQWLMWLRESPVTREMTLIQRLFPAQPGRALAQVQARRCRSLSLARPLNSPGSTEGGHGFGDRRWIPLEPPRVTACLALGGHSPTEAQCENTPGMLLGEAGERQQPVPVGSWLAAWLGRCCSAQGAASHSGEGNIYKQQRGGAHRPVWGRRLKGE